MNSDRQCTNGRATETGLLGENESFAQRMTTQQRFEFLLRQLGDQRQFILTLEARGYTLTAAVSTALIVLPALAVDKGLACSVILVFSLVILLTVIAAISGFFLIKDRAHLQWLRRSIIRTMQVLGAYRERIYVSEELAASGHEVAFSELTLYDKASQKWGQSLWLETHVLFALAVGICWASGVAIALFANRPCS